MFRFCRELCGFEHEAEVGPEEGTSREGEGWVDEDFNDFLLKKLCSGIISDNICNRGFK